MKTLIIILSLLANVGHCANEVKLHLIQGLDGAGEFKIIERWTDPVPFVYLGIKLNIDNVKVIIIQDINKKNEICKTYDSGDHLFYFRVDKPIQKRRLMIRVDKPCVNKSIDNANLKLLVITADKKQYHAGLRFEK